MKNIRTEALLFGGAAKRRISFIGRTLLYTLIVSVVTAFCMYMPLYKENYTNFYANSSYDYFIQETNKAQIESLTQKNFVEGLFPFSLMIFHLNKRVNAPENHGREIALMAADSFEGIEYSSFASDSVIAQDSAILSDESRNPIIIDYSLSKSEHITVGDTFSLYSEREFGENVKKFTVGAVYQNHCEFANFDAVILINDRINSDMLKLDPYAGYSLAYVKASDQDAWESYLKNDFYPQLSFPTLSDFRSIPAEMQASYYESHADREASAEDALDYSAVGMIAIAAAAFMLFIVLMKREHEKCLENKMYSIAVLYALGMKKRTLLCKLFMNSFLPVSASVVLACLLNKFVIFRFITNGIYVPLESILTYGAACLAAAFTVILVLNLSMTAKRITPETVLEQISNEKGIS